MSGKGVVAVLSLLVLCSAGAAAAEEAPPASVGLGLRTWVTSGYTKWSFTGSGISPLSELRWRGTDVVIEEGSADLVWSRLLLMMSLGGGRITDGVLIDDDFLQSGRRGRFSHTRSSVDDQGVFYVNGDVGFRLLDWRQDRSSVPGYLDVFLGWQYWTEKYVAFGATGTGTVASGVKALTHDYSWSSLRLGGRTRIPVYAGLALHARAVLLPYTHTELDDIHHLRTDLRQDPSFSSEADGGFGVQLDAGVTYTLWKGVSVEAGYQFWRIDAGEGDKFTHATTGTTKDRLNEIVIERGGPYLGLRFRF